MAPVRRTVLVLAVVATVVSAACSGGGSMPGAASPSPTRLSPASVTTSTTVVASTTTPARNSTVVTGRMQVALDAFVAGQDVPFSVVAEDVASGARVEHLADRVVLSASLYKLFVARELLRRIDAGDLDGDDPAYDGNGRTIGECVEAMIVVSDNDCGVAGLRLVGGGALDPSLAADGFTQTSLASPQQTTADDVALFFERLRDGSQVSGQLEALLSAQQVNDRIPMGLPAGTRIAHKTGDRRQWAHDAGTISAPAGDLILVVLSGPWPSPCCDADHPGAAEAAAFGAIADVAKGIYAAASG